MDLGSIEYYCMWGWVECFFSGRVNLGLMAGMCWVLILPLGVRAQNAGTQEGQSDTLQEEAKVEEFIYDYPIIFNKAKNNESFSLGQWEIFEADALPPAKIFKA